MMDKNLNIATWNLCLGIANKKDTVTSYLTSNNIQVCCLQETEVNLGLTVKKLTINKALK